MTLPRNARIVMQPRPSAPTPTPIWRELDHTDFWTLLEDRGHRLVCARRNDKALSDLEDIARFQAKISAHLATINRDHWGVLVDLRAAPMRNDSAFEEKIRPMAAGALNGFRRTAILVRTQVGKLQVDRTRRENGTKAASNGVFLDELDAIAFLLS